MFRDGHARRYNHQNNATAGLLWNGLVQAVMNGSTASGEGTLGKPFTISETGAGGMWSALRRGGCARGAWDTAKLGP